MSFSGTPLTTYHTSSWKRGVAMLAAAGAIVFAGLVVAGPQPMISWWTLLDLQVCRRLPDRAEVEDPADRLDAYRGDDDRAPNGPDAAD